MIAASLTENERQVLYRLVAYPRAQDREISEALGLGVSTVTKLRNRFLRRGMLRRVNIPEMQRLGAELLVIGYGELNPDISMDHKIRVGERLIKSSRSTFLTAGDGNQAFGFGFSRNYTQAMEEILHTESLAGGNLKNPYEGFNYVFVSFRIAKIFRFFNYAPLLSSAFGIDDPDFHEPELYFPAGTPVHLNSRERQVLCAIIRHPEKNNRELSSMLNITRQTVSSIRKRLMEQGLVKPAYIPDIAMLNFEMLSLVHMRLKSNAASQICPEVLGENLRRDGIIFSLMHGTDIVFMHAAPNFSTGKKILSEGVRKARNADALSKEPVIFMFPASAVIYPLFHDYSTPLRALFDENEDSD